MKLVIDQGNTSTKIAVFKENKILEKFNFSRNDSHLAQDKINNLLNDIEDIIVANVTHHKFNFGDKNHINFTNQTKVPILNDYKSPETLGADRLANAVGGYSLNPKGKNLVIDIGTCVKYDIVIEGKYIGGNISPGVAMRYKGLNDFTDQLPLLDAEDFTYGYGINTKTSLLNGVQHGLYHEINGFIERYSNQYKGLTIFMTGGDSKFFDKEYKNPIFANSNLTLIGLNEILKHNAE